MNTLLFKSKIDTWLFWCMIFSVVMSIIAILLATTVAPKFAWLITLISLPLGILLPIWLIKSTNYTLTTNELLIKSGPFNWKIALNNIISVTPTRNSLSSPALSLDRLAIKYDNDKTIMISPENQTLFLDELAKRKA